MIQPHARARKGIKGSRFAHKSSQKMLMVEHSFTISSLFAIDFYFFYFYFFIYGVLPYARVAKATAVQLDDGRHYPRRVGAWEEGRGLLLLLPLTFSLVLYPLSFLLLPFIILLFNFVFRIFALVCSVLVVFADLG